jgi:hypothetical protein
MREIRRFIVDNLSHHPELALEWISIDDDRAERILRSPDIPKDPKPNKKRKDKGKGKAPAVANSSMNSVFPPMPVDWDAASSSDEDEEDLHSNLKLETMENVHFYEVRDVRIFTKEVLAGRL